MHIFLKIYSFIMKIPLFHRFKTQIYVVIQHKTLFNERMGKSSMIRYTKIKLK